MAAARHSLAFGPNLVPPDQQQNPMAMAMVVNNRISPSVILRAFLT